ncbi:MAG: ABC transporter permease [Acidimicrobiales bacterium]|nr:ABC transporter permease [Acidimicrobiales bacterium]
MTGDMGAYRVNNRVASEGPAGGSESSGPVDREFTVEARTQRQMVISRFFHHRLAMISLAVLIFIVMLAFVGLRLWKHDYNFAGIVENGGRPTLDAIPWLDGDGVMLGEHPFGQDNIGRDYFAVTLRGAQQSIIIATVAGVIATVIGTVVGGLAGFYRGWVDNVLMRFVDVLFTIPLLLVAAVLGRTFDSKSIFVLALIIALASWLSTSRVIRAEFMSLREKEFVEAARALGATNSRIMWKHILPNVIGSVIVFATLLISAAILVETALSYLGLGVSGSDWSLGKQVSQYQSAFNTRPWLFWWPGMFIVTIALCINFIGDGLRDAFDARQNRVRQ